MGLANTLGLCLVLGLLSQFTRAASNFNVVNRCSYTVWAAATPRGGRRLDQGQSWTFDVPAGTIGGRIWGRTNCSFDANGRGSCLSGDCNGLLECQAYGSPPNTLAEFALNQYSNLDLYVISVVEGFNIPTGFRPSNASCQKIRCARPSIISQCPAQLKAPGGCNNPCTVFNTSEYCCTEGTSCGPTDLSKFFKQKCPVAHSYPEEDATSAFTCAAATNYTVTFCPANGLAETTDGTPVPAPNHSPARSRAVLGCVFSWHFFFSFIHIYLVNYNFNSS